MPLLDRVIPILSLAFLAFAVGGCGSSTTARPHAITVVDREALLAELDQAHGDVAVLNFWATWCAPCVEELPHFARLAEAYGLRGLRVIAVSFDDPETVESRVRPFVEERGYPFTYLVKADTDGEEYEAFINAVDPTWRGNVPATFVFDADGKMRATFHGPVTYAELEAAVQTHFSLDSGSRRDPGPRDASAIAQLG